MMNPNIQETPQTNSSSNTNSDIGTSEYLEEKANLTAKLARAKTSGIAAALRIIKSHIVQLERDYSRNTGSEE